MSQWKTKKLRELVDPDRGISYGVVQPGQPCAVGVPIVRVNNVRNRRMIRESVLRIAPEIEHKYSRTRLRGGEVLLTIVGTVGETCIADETIAGWNVARAIAVIPPDLGVSSRWIQICLETKGVKEKIDSRVNTTVQTTLNLKDIVALDIPYPPDGDRLAIEEFVCALDDKIELNRKMNATLEAMARALFKSWFVDFDPVKAKSEGREPFGMDAETAALFPSRLVPSALGDIPEGSEVGRLSDLLELRYGKGLTKEDRQEGPYPVYGSGGITGYHNQSLVSGPGIIVGRKGTVGSLYWEDRDFFPIDTVFFVEPLKHFSLPYILSQLETIGLENMNTDAAVPGLNRENAYRLDVVVPPEPIVKAYTALALRNRDKIRANNQESEKLVGMRDYLLPKLISGEIRIPDAEKMVGGV